ncbi:MAG: alpha/beta hydrolase-fold protein, partial [Chitinophagaceae bacterium]
LMMMVMAGAEVVYVAGVDVADIADDDGQKMLRFFYEDPGKTHGESLMLEIYPPDPPGPLQVLMTYDEENKRYSASIARPKDAGEAFYITTVTTVEGKTVPADTLQEGFISLKDGIQQPVTKIPGVPEGRLQDFLLKANGEIHAIAGKTDPTTLEEGERFIKIYTPPDYNPGREPPYNLQITLDGGQYLWPMKMDVVLDSLIAAEAIEPVVAVFISPCSGPPDDEKKGFGIVMPPGYSLSMRLKEYSCNPEYADRLAVLPATLQERFNVTRDPEHTTIWGMSAGGLQAEYTALLHPEVFGNVVAQSPMAFNIPTQNGEAWRDGIVDEFDEAGADITWSTGTAVLPAIEAPHDEYITAALRTGHDEISGRDINPDGLPLRMYFDAGKKEEEYNAAEGSANLVKSTELFAEALRERGHTVIDDRVHVIPGGHHPMTWMRNLADAARSIHPPSPQLRDEHSTAPMAVPTRTVDPEMTHQFKDRLREIVPDKSAPSVAAKPTILSPAPSAKVESETDDTSFKPR